MLITPKNFGIPQSEYDSLGNDIKVSSRVIYASVSNSHLGICLQ